MVARDGRVLWVGPRADTDPHGTGSSRGRSRTCPFAIDLGAGEVEK